jgi:hypothetical protein
VAWWTMTGVDRFRDFNPFREHEARSGRRDYRDGSMIRIGRPWLTNE